MYKYIKKNMRIALLLCHVIYVKSEVNPLLYHLLPPPPEAFDHSKRHSSYPYISGDTFRALCDHHIDETKRPFNPNEVQEGDIIFLDGYPKYLDQFVRYLPSIKHKIILVSYDDPTIPGRYAYLLNDARIVAWFAQNIGIEHPKLFPIPRGLSAPHTPHGKIEIITDVIAQTKNAEKKYFLYLNFETSTNHKVRDSIFAYFKDQPFSYLTERKIWAEYLRDMAHSKFVLSPPGNGLDCHRTWEALLVGSIPIIKSTTIDRLFKDLPVVIVKDWSQVTQEFLNAQYEEIQKGTYNLEKLYADYWINPIKEMQKAIRNHER